MSKPASALRTLGKHFLHFFSGNLAALLLGLVSFPVLTRVLSEEDYGTMSLITVAASLSVAVAKAGLSDGIIRFYKEYADEAGRLSMFTSTVVVRGVILAAIVTLAYLFVSPPLQRTLGLRAAVLPAFMIMGAYLFVRPLNIIVFNYLRATGRTVFYNAVLLMIKVASVGLALVLLFAFNRQLPAYFAGVAAGEMLGSLVLWRWLFANYSVHFSQVSGELSRRLIAFGVPLLATELGYLLLIYSDRYIITLFNGPAAVAQYSVGYNLPAYLNDLVLFSVSYAIVPIYMDLYATKGKAETESFLAKALKYYIIGVIPLCAGYAAVARDLIVIFASTKYADSASFSPLIVCGLTFMGMNYILYAGLYLEKRTHQILLTMAITVGINVALNLLLVPKLGPFGAATATLIACAVSSVITAVLSFRHLPIRLPWWSAVYYGGAALLMLWLLEKVDLGQAWSNVAVKVLLGGLFMAVAMFVRDREDILGLLNLLRRRA